MPTPHRVAVLALNGVYPFDLGIPARVLGAAGGRYSIVTCSVDGRAVRTNADFEISIENGPEALENAETVIVPAFETATLDRSHLATMAQALSKVAPGTRIVSICTGAFIVAAAGLLNGRRATTHWAAATLFRDWFPEVDLDPDVLFVDEGDVLTSAGAASGLDACLHLIRKDHGSEVANHAARVCVAPPWRDGGQAQYIEHHFPHTPQHASSEVREWARTRLREPLTLAMLAEHARVSPRTLSRLFDKEVGISPGRWLAQQRIDQARQLLESTDLAVEQIANQVGFQGSASLREHFGNTLGVSPNAYRRTFQGVQSQGSEITSLDLQAP
ncbi:GlxA family transcriptional regulator [Herbiconiux ginsengi]|uniref:Transcriptional regulator, AraC family with amidase-like domain n=1 Tax=Herbiconiux ginsengi TaxID=381665 RepID=A0A1H3TH84_9MICO|nr:helix-turn-helix domain-containing protein [Herbiconiux ginsengi]SDZ49643.1 transcriptional regulator, AraC family with amidase-like domain [Herbiconiux ginsengi]